MKIKPFGVEKWMNDYETRAIYNLGETCVSPLTIKELCDLVGIDSISYANELVNTQLTYGEIEGNSDFRNNIVKLYHEISSEQVVTTHGAIGANSLVLNTIVEPDDEVVVVTPTYQQLQSIPESLGATVKLIALKKENRYLPDLNELNKLINHKTKLIVINNPNNPTGALMSKEILVQIVQMAKSIDAYILSDEVYRHLNQRDCYSPSITDLYEKGISTGSMSKVFSMAGLRTGWIATQDKALMHMIKERRDYQTISGGVLNEKIASTALENAATIIHRNRMIIQKNRNIVEEWINKTKGFSWELPQAGTTGLIYYDFDISSLEFADKLMNATGVLIVPGSAFGIENAFRIGFAFEKEKLQKGLELIAMFSENI